MTLDSFNLDPVVSGFSRTTWIANCFTTVMFPNHPTHLRNFDYIGMYYYSLTWCCDYRKRVFTQEDRVALIRSQLLRACDEQEFELVAYCFMPDHLHQLVKGCSPRADARRYIARAKQYSGFYFKQAHGELPFQRYGYERLLTRDRDPRTVVGYIIENPVRAGLVAEVGDYPFTGSQKLSISELMEWAYTY